MQRKNTGVPRIAAIAKFIQILPWITRISSSGIPNDLKVKNRMIITSTSDIRLTTILSEAKDSRKSLALTDSPVSTTPSG